MSPERLNDGDLPGAHLAKGGGIRWTSVQNLESARHRTRKHVLGRETGPWVTLVQCMGCDHGTVIEEGFDWGTSIRSPCFFI